MQAFVFFLLCVAPHPVLCFLTGPCPVGFAGRNHYKGVAKAVVIVDRVGESADKIGHRNDAVDGFGHVPPFGGRLQAHAVG